MEFSSQIADKYLAYWNLCQIRPNKASAVKSVAKQVLKNKAKYEQVASEFGCPWYWIGAIHSLESSCDFGTWLANGDDVRYPTVHVPEGLDCDGTWVDGARVSLNYQGIPKKGWDLARCLYEWVKYNGFGYDSHNKPSQYVWSFTNVEQAGRYVADSVWDASAWSDQVGCAAILKTLIEMGEVNLQGEVPVPTVPAGKVTWYEANRNDKGDTIIIGMAGDKAISLLTTNDSSVIVEYLTENGVHDLRVAPAGKAIPHMPGSGTGPVVAPSPVAVINAKLDAFYKAKANYDAVYANVMRWFGTLKNACCAFQSSAMRMCGVNIPLHFMVRGEDSSLVTLPLSLYIQENLGWKKITNQDDLLPGDVCFTEDDADWPGYPSHVFQFSSWSFKSRGVAWVIDNQGPLHERNINEGGGGFNFTPFAYALRAV